MVEENYNKLWVLKFCLKVLYPKYNLYQFLVYLVVRYRILLGEQAIEPGKLYQKRHTNMHKLSAVHKKYLSILGDIPKDESIDSESYSDFLIVPQKVYTKMVTENLFYSDHNTVWVSLQLSPDLKEKLKTKKAVDEAKAKYDFKRLKSRIHRQLWQGDTHEKYENVRILRITGSDKIPEDMIICSEDEEYNIKTCFDFPLHKDSMEVVIKPVTSMEYVPQIATSAVVQMIVNPFDLSNDFVTEILSNHFKSPRLVHVDDIFSIELSREILLKYYYKYFDLVESTPNIYFKCEKINGNEVNKSNVMAPFFIVKGKTELSLGENVHSVIPSVKYFTPAIDDESVLTETCPFGLREYFVKIQESILPFIVTRQDKHLYTSLLTLVKPMFLLSGSRGSGRHILVKSLAKYNGLNCLVADCNAIQSSTAKQTESKINSLIQRAKGCSPVILVLDNFEVFAVDAENNEDCRIVEYFRNITKNLFEHYEKQTIIIIAVSERFDLKPNILKLFLDKFHMTKPTNVERFQILEWYLRVMNLKLNITNNENHNKTDPKSSILSKENKEMVQRLAAKTETFLYGDLDTLVHFALRNAFMDNIGSVKEKSFSEILSTIREEDFTNAIESMRALQSQHMDAPKIAKVYWDDIGGLDSLKKELLKTIEFPIKYPHLFKNSSLKRSGILLYGPPGCGKTLVAKALSTELNASFLSVKGPELLNMYIGQSEENVRKVFESARAASPCIVFLDELDALAPRRGATGDSGGASDRVVSQLLAEIDGVASTGESASSFVFIMGATNRPDLLEQSLLRPGRLDKLIYVGPYCGQEEKTRVLTALCHRQKLSEDVSLERVCCSLPSRCTGADLMQVLNVARAAANRRAIRDLHQGLVREIELASNAIVLEASDFEEGVAAFKPSTTDEEFAYYERLKGQM